MGKSTISTGPFSSSLFVCLPGRVIQRPKVQNHSRYICHIIHSQALDVQSYPRVIRENGHDRGGRRWQPWLRKEGAVPGGKTSWISLQ